MGYMYSTNTIACKMQFKQVFHNVHRRNLYINESSMKIKGIIDSLGSIGVPIDDEGLVFVTLNGPGKEYAQFHTCIRVYETFPKF